MEFESHWKESDNCMYKLSPKQTKEKMSRRELCCAQLFGVFLFCIGFTSGILVGIYLYHGGPDAEVTCKNIPEIKDCEVTQTTTERTTTVSTSPSDEPTEPPTVGECIKCKSRQARYPWDGDNPEIFAPLTAEEMIKVNDHLITNNYAYNLSSIEDSDVTLAMNYIVYMYLFLPNKDAVLKYKAGNGPYPGRYARVHVARGNRPTPDYMEYKVGPLQTDNMSVTQIYADGILVFNSRPYDDIELIYYKRLLIPELQILEPLTKESFDGGYYGKADTDFSFWVWNGPPGAVADERETRVAAYLNPLAPGGMDYLELDFVPLSATIHCPGTNFSQWYIYDYYYLNQGPFQNASALLSAYQSGSMRKFSLPAGYRDTVYPRSLPDRDTNQPFRRHSHLSPPRTYEPDGPRYTINGHNVDWMDWNFDITTSALRGPSLFEVTFKGLKIAYEISLNEIEIVYGSGASAQTNVIYTDSSYGIGHYYGIMRGVDCPEHGTLLETSHWLGHSPEVSKSICVFEADGEDALWRHKAYEFEGGLRNNYLVVRLSSTIVNYDYIIEWHFYLDGKIFTVVGASGYIQGTFWDHENPFMGSDKGRDAFGFRVAENTHGQIHDHMFGFKVDLDILGTDNTMEVIHWKAGGVVSALQSQVPNVTEVPPYFLHNNTRYLEYEYIETETAKRINMDEPKFWVVVNENERNKWGVERGYRIQPFATASQILTNDNPAMPALSFSKYHCTVTKRKETEQYLTSTSDSHRLDKPIEDLEKLLNNEVVRDTDIVNWVTVGFLHVPTSEDVPLTNRVESGFVLKPFNFFDKTAVFDMQGYLNTKTNWRTERPPENTPCLERKP